MIDFCDNDAMRHKKKKDQKSKSNKRSTHKHQYEKVIIESFFGWCWGLQCTQCGRLKYNALTHTDEFTRPEYIGGHWISKQCFYTYEELKEKYPNTKIIIDNF